MLMRHPCPILTASAPSPSFLSDAHLGKQQMAEYLPSMPETWIRFLGPPARPSLSCSGHLEDVPADGRLLSVLKNVEKRTRDANCIVLDLVNISKCWFPGFQFSHRSWSNSMFKKIDLSSFQSFWFSVLKNHSSFLCVPLSYSIINYKKAPADIMRINILSNHHSGWCSAERDRSECTRAWPAH